MPEELLYVNVCEAKPNPMFTEQQRASVRFLLYNKPVACDECGKRKRKHWTMICEFLAHSMASFVPFKSGLVHMPLAPVCTDHLLAPAWAPKEASDGEGREGPEDAAQPPEQQDEAAREVQSEP